MILGAAELTLLLGACAPAIHVTTAQALIKQESGGAPYAIGINGKARLTQAPASEAQAIATAKWLIAQGISIDLGLAQINSANLPSLGLSVDTIFKPCVNLGAMQTILLANYRDASKTHGEGQRALQAALSAYNTGNGVSGFSNGYVRAVYRQAAK